MIQYCSTTDTHTDDCSTREHHKGFVGSLQIHVHLWLTGAAVEHQLGGSAALSHAQQQR